MPVKPRAHVPQTGAILRSWRLSELGKKSSLDEVVKRLARLGVKAAKSTLSRYENGERVPDLVILRGLAAIYGVEFREIVIALVDELSGSTLRMTPDVIDRLDSIGHEETENIPTEQEAPVHDMWGFIGGEIAQLPEELRAQARSAVRTAVETALQPFLSGNELGPPVADRKRQR